MQELFGGKGSNETKINLNRLRDGGSTVFR